MKEYSPKGPTERHLVETLATIMWRQQRVMQAESADLRRGLCDAVGMTKATVERATAHLNVTRTPGTPGDAIEATDEENERELIEVQENLTTLQRAKAVVDADGPDAYTDALMSFDDDWRDAWQDALDGNYDPDTKYEATADSLRDFIVEQETWYREERTRYERRPLIRSQAIGQAINPDRLTRLARYETHLDRKLERTVAMLLKLQDMRRSIPAPA